MSPAFVISRVGLYTKPEKPINAIAKIPAVISAIGTPRINAGVSFISNFSRIPANNVIANVKPIAVAKANTTLSPIVNSFCTNKIATPNTAQLVVISGKNTPRAEYNAGETFFNIISTI